ncbi:MAG: hypothetical protein ACLRIL_11185 [Fusicatenibacter saccharivorans]
MKSKPVKDRPENPCRKRGNLCTGWHMAGSVAIAAESIDAAVAHVDEAKRKMST